MVKGHVWEGQIAGNPPQNVMLPEKIICEAYASFPQITTSSVVCGDLWSFLVMPGPGEYHLPMVPQWEDQAPLAHLMWGLPGGVVKTCWTKTTYSWDIRVYPIFRVDEHPSTWSPFPSDDTTMKPGVDGFSCFPTRNSQRPGALGPFLRVVL